MVESEANSHGLGHDIVRETQAFLSTSNQCVGNIVAAEEIHWGECGGQCCQCRSMGMV